MRWSVSPDPEGAPSLHGVAWFSIGRRMYWWPGLAAVPVSATHRSISTAVVVCTLGCLNPPCLKAVLCTDDELINRDGGVHRVIDQDLFNLPPGTYDHTVEVANHEPGFIDDRHTSP